MVTKNDIGAVFTQGLKLSSLIDKEALEKLKHYKIAVAYIFGAMVNLIIAFVFFAGAIMFVIRTVILIFLMVLSPLAFVAMILPGLQGHARKWWNALLGQAFFAPAFLFLAYLVAEIIRSGTLFPPAGQSLGNAALDPLSNVNIVLTYILIAGLIIASLIVAKQIAGSTATMATGLATKYARRPLERMGKAGGRMLRRQTWDRGMSAAAGRVATSEFGRKNPTIGRLATTTLDKAGGTSYDKYLKNQENKRVAYGARSSGESRSEQTQRLRYEASARASHSSGELDDAQLATTLSVLDAERKDNERTRREAHATSYEQKGKFGQMIQRVTGQERAEREAAKRIRDTKDKGEKSPKDLLEDAIKKITEGETKIPDSEKEASKET